LYFFMVNPPHLFSAADSIWAVPASAAATTLFFGLSEFNANHYAGFVEDVGSELVRIFQGREAVTSPLPYDRVFHRLSPYWAKGRPPGRAAVRKVTL
jgi:hypothetical protein